MNRLIAIGDIHGNSSFLEKILVEINPQIEDTIVFLGDYIDRGPDSKGVIDQIVDLHQKCKVHLILGNHEEMTLAAHAGGKSDHQFWCKFGGKEMLESYSVDHVSKLPSDYWRFVANCVDFVETDNHIFVHATCDPLIPLPENSATKLRWDRFPENPQPHFSGKKVICGHTVQETILDLGFIACIDTGSGVFPNGKLTALDVNSGIYWQFGGKMKKVKNGKL
jgi:serine/threonine protein phosphatase 1